MGAGSGNGTTGQVGYHVFVGYESFFLVFVCFTGRLAYHWDAWDCRGGGKKLGERRCRLPSFLHQV